MPTDLSQEDLFTEPATTSFFRARRGSIPSDILDFTKWDAFLLPLDSLPSVLHTPCLIDDMIQAVCTCFSISTPADDPLQLSVIKVLLTLLTSPLVEIHGHSLLKVFQTCFHIHVHSKNGIHAGTAKASLTQMMNVVLAKMEKIALVTVCFWV